MKKLFTILILLPFFCTAQTYVTMSAKLNSLTPVYTSASVGYQFNSNVITEAMMDVPISNNAEYAAYFLAQTGYVISLSDSWQIAPIAGFGYALRSTDDSRYNGIVWAASFRIIHNCILLNTGVLEHKLFISIGLIGVFDRKNAD